MSRIIKSEPAKRDLQSIWRYIAPDAPSAADTVLRNIAVKLNRLAQNPNLGRPRPELQPGLRSVPCGAYILFYRPRPGGIELIHVLHGARDIAATFESEPALE